MKIALLINHYTAAKFYNDIFLKLGYKTYIPLFCKIENYCLSYDECINTRTINDCNFF